MNLKDPAILVVVFTLLVCLTAVVLSYKPNGTAGQQCLPDGTCKGSHLHCVVTYAALTQCLPVTQQEWNARNLCN